MKLSTPSIYEGVFTCLFIFYCASLILTLRWSPGALKHVAIYQCPYLYCACICQYFYMIKILLWGFQAPQVTNAGLNTQIRVLLLSNLNGMFPFVVIALIRVAANMLKICVLNILIALSFKDLNIFILKKLISNSKIP